jgi:hypothetical protein
MDQLTSLDTWAKLGEVVALLVFAWVLIDARMRKQSQEIVQWQKVVVFDYARKKRKSLDYNRGGQAASWAEPSAFESISAIPSFTSRGT